MSSQFHTPYVFQAWPVPKRKKNAKSAEILNCSSSILLLVYNVEMAAEK